MMRQGPCYAFSEFRFGINQSLYLRFLWREHRISQSPERHQSSRCVSIIAVSVAADLVVFCVSLNFAGSVSDSWPSEGNYLESLSQAGKVVSTIELDSLKESLNT